MNDLHSYPQWGTYSFVDGWRIPEAKNLMELAAKGNDDLLHVINILLKQDSKEAEDLAEVLFDRYS